MSSKAYKYVEKKKKKKKKKKSKDGESGENPNQDKVVVHGAALDKAVEEIFDYLFEEFVVTTGTQIGRELRYGELEELGLLDEVKDEFKVNTTPGLDIFGQPTSKNAGVSFEIECPKCNRTLVTTRFSQHLEKCMGMGRKCSRIANRRTPATSTVTSSSSAAAATATATGTADAEPGGSDEDDDEEWTKERKKKGKKSSSKKNANSEGR